MKIQVIFTGYYPNGNVTSERVHFLCKGMVENGADLELLLTTPLQSSNDREQTGDHENVHFRYLSFTRQMGKGKIKNLLIKVSCQVKALTQFIVNKSNFDCFLIIGPSLDFRILFPLVGKLIRRIVLLEINEYPFISKENRPFAKIRLFLFLRLIIPNYDGFIVISSTLKNLIDQYKSKKARTIIVPIIGEKSNLEEERWDSRSRVEKYIIHAGSISEQKDGIRGVIDALRITIFEFHLSIKLIITGNFYNQREFSFLRNYIEDSGMDNYVRFTGFLEEKELNNYLANSTLAVINKYSNKQNMYCFPTKLIKYLDYGIPVVITRVGDISSYFVDNYNAIIIEPNNAEVLAKAIVEALKDDRKLRSIANNARKLLDLEFNYKVQGCRLIEIIAEICKSNDFLARGQVHIHESE